MSATMSVLRAVRSAVFAALCVLLALTAHTLTTDAPVRPWVPPAAGAVVAAAAWAAARRERGLAAIGGGLITVQAALHALFAFAQRPAPGSGMTPAGIEAQWRRVLMCNDPPGREPAHSVPELLAAMRLDPDLSRYPPHTVGFGGSSGGAHGTHGTAAHHGDLAAFLPGHGGFGMFAAHMLAALGCAVWLRHGEKALFRLVRLLAVNAATGVLTIIVAWTARGSRREHVLRRTPPRRVRAVFRWVCRPLTVRGPPGVLVT